MTDNEARALRPGDHIRLRLQPWNPNPAGRTRFVVLRVEEDVDGNPRVISVEGFRFVPWEIKRE